MHAFILAAVVMLGAASGAAAEAGAKKRWKQAKKTYGKIVSLDIAKSALKIVDKAGRAHTLALNDATELSKGGAWTPIKAADLRVGDRVHFVAGESAVRMVHVNVFIAKKRKTPRRAPMPVEPDDGDEPEDSDESFVEAEGFGDAPAQNEDAADEGVDLDADRSLPLLDEESDGPAPAVQTADSGDEAADEENRAGSLDDEE